MSGEITQEVAGETTVQVAPPGDAVTTYEVGVPPVDGATTWIEALPFPGVIIGFPGLPGT